MLGLLLAWVLQAPPADAVLLDVRATLRQMHAQVTRNKLTFGVTAAGASVKHRLRDWVESRILRTPVDVDVRALNAGFHGALRRANLLCDDCEVDVLGYLDDVRVSRAGNALIVVTALGTYCGYDESAYAYEWNGTRWLRTWEHEQNVATKGPPPRYLPQQIHDVQISEPDGAGRRLLMELGSQTVCGGSFKDLYARAWRLSPPEGGHDDFRSTKLLDTTVFGNDGYPPLLGRVTPNDVLFTYTADGFANGDTHVAVRRFVVDGDAMKQVDPIALVPRDFVLEQLPNPRHYGDFAEPTRRCGTTDEWQVGTHLFEGPKRYYRVRWTAPFSFTLLGTSETPYPDCKDTDARSDVYLDVLHWRF